VTSFNADFNLAGEHTGTERPAAERDAVQRRGLTEIGYRG